MMSNKLLKLPVVCMLLASLSGGEVQAYSHGHSDLNSPANKSALMKPQVPVRPAQFGHVGTNGLYFLENKGQIVDQNRQLRDDIDFKLVTRTNVNVFIGSGNIHYQWNSMNPETEMVHTYRMDVTLVGANKDATIVREGYQDYFEQYYKGENPSKAMAFNKVVYQDIYPNIDWVLYLNDNTFEYDFVVHPGGRVSDINIQFDGAQSLRINKDGSFTATTPAGSITENAPYSFDEQGNEVASRFHLNGNKLSFKTAPYNSFEKFTIDPTVEWATYYGGIGPGYTTQFGTPGAEWDVGNATAFDDELNVYMVGYTNSLNNIATTGAFQQAWGGTNNPNAGPNDAFLVKFDATGKRLWGTYYGGNGGEDGTGVAVDELGFIYMVGSSGSTDVNLSTTGSHQTTLNGGSDAFIVKFDGAGNRIWATYFGGEAADDATDIVSDKGGHIYIAGHTRSTTGIAHGSAFQSTHGGAVDVYLAKFTEDGVLSWATYYGDAQNEGTDNLPAKVGWDATNQKVYLASTTDMSTNLATPGSYQPNLDGLYDGFLVKFDVQGQREWATYFGGPSLEMANSVAVDDAGNVYMTGIVRSPGLATPGAHQDTVSGGQCNFLVKFYTDGTRDWCTYYGGSAAHVTTQGYSVYLGGQTADTAGIATPGAPHDTLIGLADVFMVKFDTTGVREWGTYFGSNTNDNGGYLAADGYGNIYMTGRTYRPIGHPNAGSLATPGAHQDTFADGGAAGSLDAFLVKFSDCVQDLAITIDSLTMGVTGSSVYKNYQWYKDGNPIQDATDSTYTAKENGMYSVKVNSALNGCPDSAWYEINNIIDDDDDDDDDVSVGRYNKSETVKVFPNPASNTIYIQSVQPVNIQLKSIDGKLILNQQAATSVDISKLASGIYLLTISDQEGKVIHTEKLIKEGQKI